MIFIYVFYMDLFMEQNFLMNLIVLFLTQLFCNRYAPKRYAWRILAALLGAAGGTVVLVFTSFMLYVVSMALFFVPLMVGIAFGRQCLRRFVRGILISWLAIVIVNGVVSVGYQWTGVQSMTWYLAILALLVAQLLVRTLIGSIRQQAQTMQVDLSHRGEHVSCVGLYDSGNRLQMPDSGAPVHIISERVLRQLGAWEEEKRLIPYRALGTEQGQIGVVQIDEMKIASGGKSVCYENAWIGSADESLLQNRNYQMILNAAVCLR